MRYVGIDVAAKTLAVVIRRNGKPGKCKEFANTVSGHQQLVRYINPKKHTARVCLEATGNYHFDSALYLADTVNIEVMVLNPKLSKRFAESLNKQDKTDAVDAAVLAEYVERMEFRAWVKPKNETIQLRAFSRQLASLTHMRAQCKNQLHALTVSTGYEVKTIIKSQERLIKTLCKEIECLKEKARAHITKHPSIEKKFELLISVKGIAETSAIQILGELLILPEEMKHKQWVKYAGLNPIQTSSGSSVFKKPRISKAGCRRLRTALYMPALSAVRHDPFVRGFYLHLIEDKGLKKIQALCAVMRKLVHAIHGMLLNDQPFDNTRFYHKPAVKAAVDLEELELALAA